MTSGWLATLGIVFPLAMVVAMSPMAVVPAVLLVLHTPAPKRSGLAYFFARFVGLAAMAAIGLRLPHLGSGLEVPSAPWTLWPRMLGGAVLVVAGIWAWSRRARQRQSARWVSVVGKITPGSAAAIGMAVTVVNPKVLLMSAGAGLAIGTAGLSAPMTSLSVAYYAVVASSTVGLPVVAYVWAADGIADTLERFKQWIERHQTALAAVIMVAVGLVLLATGAREL